MNWHKIPFLRLLIPLSAGILLADHHLLPTLYLPLTFLALLLLIFLFLLLHHFLKEYRHRWLLGMLVLLIFTIVGFLLRCLREPLEVAGTPDGYLIARVYDPPVEREKNVKMILELRGNALHGISRPISGKVMAYLEKTDDALRLSYGDLLAFHAEVETVAPPLNPNEFDYRLYLRRQGVTGRVFLKEGDWLPTGIHAGSPIFSFASRFRSRLLEVLQRNGITEDEFGVGAAVLLGYDESLSPEMRQHYVAAGSMHILCVSGMHVGIIYLMASYLLGFIGKGRRMVRIRKVILLLLIWFYALLTGLSPSIMRSALMISMVILGELIHRKGVLLNSIAASAFVLLVINPCNLFSIGFQLSYVAVLGIVLLQRPIYLLFYIRNKLLDKVWEITAVTLAAQIATMPFAVYYFNQFTPYFWLSNLFMTPLSFLVILTGMLLLIVSWVPWLNLLVGKAVWACLHVMNASVAWVDHLPCSLVKGLYMDEPQFVLGLLMLLLFLLFVTLRKKRILLELVVVACLFSGTMALRAQRTSLQEGLQVYSLRKHTAIDLVHGDLHVLLCDEGLLADASVIDYSLKGAWAQRQLCMNPPCFVLSDDLDVGWAVKKGPLLSFEGTLMAFYEPGAMPVDHPIPVDILMVWGKQKASLRQALQSYQPGLLLIDGSVPSYLAEDWQRQAEELSVPYSLGSSAAFAMRLD